MIDVKKLISGFLILAAAAVGSGFILSFAGDFASSPSAPAGPTITAAPGSSNPIAAAGGSAVNAFVDTGSLQSNAAEIYTATISTTTEAIANDPNNITDTFANSLLNGLVAANPGGVSTDQSGNLNFSAPNTQAVAQDIAANAAVQGLQVPNWDMEAQSQVIKTTDASSQTAVAQYADSLNSVYQKYFVANGLNTTINGQGGDANEAAYIASQLQGAITDTLAIPTPKPLVGFQQDLVRLFVYEKNMALTTANANTDPMRSALIVQAEQSKYDAVVAELQSAEQNAQNLGLSFAGNPSKNNPSFIAGLFGIQTAHAQFGGVVFDPTSFGQLVKNYLENILLQILKNTIVALMQRKVLTWIQGSGAPRFVQQFGEQLVNAVQSAAVNKINSYMACVPAYQTPAVSALISTPSVPIKDICGAEFNAQLGNNFANFYNNFDNFNNYLQLFQSGGNYWTAAIQTRDAAVNAGSNSQTAQQTQTISQQGWSGSAVCDDGSNPQGTKVVCSSLDDPGYSYPSPDGTCDNGFYAEHLPNDGKCADGSDPTITNPGQVTGQAVFTAVKSGSEDVTSANDIAGLLNAFISSLLNTLAQDAINFSNQTVNGALSGGGGGGGGGAAGGGPTDGGLLGVSSSTITGNGSSTPATPVECFPSIDQLTISTTTGIATASLSAGGGAIDNACAVGGNCPANENPDGSPIYTWTAPGSVEGASGAPLSGSTVSLTFNTPGTYNVTVNASTDNTNAQCQIQVQ